MSAVVYLPIIIALAGAQLSSEYHLDFREGEPLLAEFGPTGVRGEAGGPGDHM